MRSARWADAGAVFGRRLQTSRMSRSSLVRVSSGRGTPSGHEYGQEVILVEIGCDISPLGWMPRALAMVKPCEIERAADVVGRPWPVRARAGAVLPRLAGCRRMSAAVQPKNLPARSNRVVGNEDCAAR